MPVLARAVAYSFKRSYWRDSATFSWSVNTPGVETSKNGRFQGAGKVYFPAPVVLITLYKGHGKRDNRTHARDGQQDA